jgi:hypothetical protein
MSQNIKRIFYVGKILKFFISAWLSRDISSEVSDPFNGRRIGKNVKFYEVFGSLETLQAP